MGNALWTGVRLRDLLEAAGIRAGAVDVSFDGLDEPPLWREARSDAQDASPCHGRLG